MLANANIDAFLAATQPLKLFQEIEFHTATDNIIRLADQVQQENILKLTRQEPGPNGEPHLRIFRIDHPKLKKWAMDVEFQMHNVGEDLPFDYIIFKLVHL